MVRNYKQRNKYYVGSKLTEEMIERIISGYIIGYTPEKMVKTLGVSERTINDVCARFRRRLLSSERLKMALLSPGFEAHEAAQFVATLHSADEGFWDDLWTCLRQCPAQLRIHARSITEYYDFIYKAAAYDALGEPLPRQEFSEVPQKFHFYLRATDCGSKCRPSGFLPIDPIMMALLSSGIQRKRLNRAMLPEHFIPLYLELFLESSTYQSTVWTAQAQGVLLSQYDFHLAWTALTNEASVYLSDRIWPLLEQEPL